ncbi:MAG: hypothetical protein U0893_20605 [Chloroflexota bacterium]
MDFSPRPPKRQTEPYNGALVCWRHCAELAAVTAGALALALTLPLATAVFGLLLFGVAHNYFELRYVVGRFGGLFEGRLAEAVLTGLTAIVLIRVLPIGALARPLEIGAGYALLGIVLTMRVTSWPMLAAGLVVIVMALALSLANPDQHFVAITHLHNVLPLVFLWEWTARAANTRTVKAFRLLHLTWAVALPAAILLGLFGDGGSVSLDAGDPTPAAAVVGDVATFVRGLTPPGADSLLGGRLLAVFALLQLMHYYVWCRFFPAVGTVEAARVDRALAGAGLPHGRRLTLLMLAVAALTFGLLWADFWQGRSLYGALAGYHAYVEYALLLLFVITWNRPRNVERGLVEGRSP